MADHDSLSLQLATKRSRPGSIDHSYPAQSGHRSDSTENRPIPSVRAIDLLNSLPSTSDQPRKIDKLSKLPPTPPTQSHRPTINHALPSAAPSDPKLASDYLSSISSVSLDIPKSQFTPVPHKRLVDLWNTLPSSSSVANPTHDIESSDILPAPPTPNDLRPIRPLPKRTPKSSLNALPLSAPQHYQPVMEQAFPPTVSSAHERAIDYPNSLPSVSPDMPMSQPTAPPPKRLIDLWNSLPSSSSMTHSTHTFEGSDFDPLPPNPPKSHSTAAPKRHLIDLWNSLPIRPSPKKPSISPRQSPPPVAGPSSSPTSKPIVGDLSNDVEMAAPEDNSDSMKETKSNPSSPRKSVRQCSNDPYTGPSPFTFNTNHICGERRKRGWAGGLRPNDWNISLEDRHADQVDYDRVLPHYLRDVGHPIFAISGSDMESLHRYLMARHHIDNYEDYLMLLAMFRNTSAIEGQKSRLRYEELRQVTLQLSVLREALIDKLKSRNPS